MALVSVRRVATYDPEALYRSVCQHFDALHVADELTPNTRVLLKPNLLAGRDPAFAVTTHPALLRAIARRLRELGVTHITLADSPGGVYTAASLRRVYAACKLSSLADVLTLNEDNAYGEKNGFSIIRPVLEADFIINCPKLKTHGLTVMSAAVKNMFGSVPGLKKPEMHYLKPTVDTFAATVLDICETVKPHLTIMDAVDCMEGNGPGNGTVRAMGYTLASRDVYAIDEAGVQLMGIRPILAPLIRLARKRGLCDPTAIETVGDTLVPANPPFTLPDTIITREHSLTPNGIFRLLFGRKRTYPLMVPEKCIGCGRCAESCPRHLIDIIDRKAVIARKGCISCFCCQEMCPVNAVDTARKQP
jgi:uncharacterized protein (DUF362 family)/Pyruvate/2-oxoacid:ferredoxin oxidoreductase delta subunit